MLRTSKLCSFLMASIIPRRHVRPAFYGFQASCPLFLPKALHPRKKGFSKEQSCSRKGEDESVVCVILFMMRMTLGDVQAET